MRTPKKLELLKRTLKRKVTESSEECFRLNLNNGFGPSFATRFLATKILAENARVHFFVETNHKFLANL